MASIEKTSPAQSGRPAAGDELTLTVSGLAHGGAGIARHDGYVVFVDGGFPSDIVRAVVIKARRAYAEASAVEIVESSPDRVPERCDQDGPRCPGSPWQGLRYERQIEHKQAQVADALARLGEFSDRGDYRLEPIVPAVEPWRYRNKMEYSFGWRTTGESAGELALGFHPRGEWQRVEDVRDCALASERNNAVRNLVRELSARHRLEPYDRRGRTGLLRNLVVREGRRTGALQVRLVTGEPGFEPQAVADGLHEQFPEAAFLVTRTDAAAEISHGGETDVLAGPERLEERLGGLEFQVSPEAFFQTNTEMAEHLYELAVAYAGLTGSERVYDIYCGIGTLSLLLALRAGDVLGVDIVESAIADAINNASLNEIDNARFFAGNARHAIRPLVEEAPRPDVIVVDPPRAGLSKKVVRRLLEAKPDRIVYVSCNPTTLAPDAREIVDGGFRLTRVRPVDMFPHTPHIECVALLERSGG